MFVQSPKDSLVLGRGRVETHTQTLWAPGYMLSWAISFHHWTPAGAIVPHGTGESVNSGDIAGQRQNWNVSKVPSVYFTSGESKRAGERKPVVALYHR